MTEAEMFTFADVVKGLERVFPKRLDDIERQRRNVDYFKALKRFPLPQVQAGADAWMQRGKFFPKPAEWIDAIPRRAVTVDVRQMAAEEVAEYRRAEALRYEDTPCGCHACFVANMNEKPLRFVPNVNHDGTDAKARLEDRPVTTGHWAHGAELARYYHTKGDFYESYAHWLQSKRIT